MDSRKIENPMQSEISIPAQQTNIITPETKLATPLDAVMVRRSAKIQAMEAKGAPSTPEPQQPRRAISHTTRMLSQPVATGFAFTITYPLQKALNELQTKPFGSTSYGHFKCLSANQSLFRILFGSNLASGLTHTWSASALKTIFTTHSASFHQSLHQKHGKEAHNAEFMEGAELSEEQFIFWNANRKRTMQLGVGIVGIGFSESLVTGPSVALQKMAMNGFNLEFTSRLHKYVLTNPAMGMRTSKLIFNQAAFVAAVRYSDKAKQAAPEDNSGLLYYGMTIGISVVNSFVNTVCEYFYARQIKGGKQIGKNKFQAQPFLDVWYQTLEKNPRAMFSGFWFGLALGVPSMTIAVKINDLFNQLEGISPPKKKSAAQERGFSFLGLFGARRTISAPVKEQQSAEVSRPKGP